MHKIFMNAPFFSVGKKGALKEKKWLKRIVNFSNQNGC
jgi:hypothetical protein